MKRFDIDDAEQQNSSLIKFLFLTDRAHILTRVLSHGEFFLYSKQLLIILSRLYHKKNGSNITFDFYSYNRMKHRICGTRHSSTSNYDYF